MTTPASYTCMHDSSSVQGNVGEFITDDLYWTNADFYSSAGVPSGCSWVMMTASDYNSITTAPITTDPVTTTPTSSYTDLWPFTLDQSMTIGAYLTLLLCVGFTWRAVIKSLKIDEGNYHENE